MEVGVTVVVCVDVSVGVSVVVYVVVGVVVNVVVAVVVGVVEPHSEPTILIALQSTFREPYPWLYEFCLEIHALCQAPPTRLLQLYTVSNGRPSLATFAF